MTKVIIKAADGTGAVEAFHNANKKLETTADGATITGKLGIGTASPSQELTLAGSDPVISVQEASVSSQVDIGTGTSTGYINIQKADGTRTVQISGSTDSYFTGGKVGIGTTSIARGPLHVHENSTADCQIHLTNNDTGATGNDGLTIFTDTDTAGIWSREAVDFQLATNNTERLRVLSGGGLTFNGDTSADNALDDYEEGQFTVTLTPNNSGTITLSAAQVMKYTKIGRVVHISGRVRIDGVSSPVGSMRINLPFANQNTGSDDAHYAHMLAITSNIELPSGALTTYFIPYSGNTTANLICMKNDAQWVAIDSSLLHDNTSQWVAVNGFYCSP